MATGQSGISMLERLGAPHDKLVNFPYWVDVPDRLQSKPETHEPLRILAIGRLVPIKNFGHLVHVAQRLHELNVKFSITIIGEGPDRQRIEAARDAAGLTTFIQLPGWNSAGQVRQQLRSHDILVHTAEWEPYGVVILEAMAQGLPVIATETTMAACDRVKPGISGELFPVGNTEAMVSAIMRTTQNRAKLLEMGNQAYRTACEWRVQRAVEIINQTIAR
jgi:glycosyltransferase involved in cell wall biosynthesis